MFSLAVNGEKIHRTPHIGMLRERNIRTGFFKDHQYEAVRASLFTLVAAATPADPDHIGAVCALVVGTVGFAWHGTVIFAAVVAGSMFISVNLSGLAGPGMLMIFKRLGFDPALTAGPFEPPFRTSAASASSCRWLPGSGLRR